MIVVMYALFVRMSTVSVPAMALYILYTIFVRMSIVSVSVTKVSFYTIF